MKMLYKTSNYNGLHIHYLDSKNEADDSLVPLFICPGLSETAEEYEDLIKFILPRRGIVLSFRGRGKSHTPQYGYNLEHHVSDIESVVNHSEIQYFHLYAYSRGVSYALEFTKQHPNKIAKIIVQDYPSEHKAMTMEWADDYINNYLIPHQRLSNIRSEAVRGIQVESTQKILVFRFQRPALVIRGLLEGSLIIEDDLKQYKTNFSNLQISEFDQSGHDIRNTEKDKLYNTIKDFLE